MGCRNSLSLPLILKQKRPLRAFARSGRLSGNLVWRQFEPVSVAGWDWAVCCVVAWSFDADLLY